MSFQDKDIVIAICHQCGKENVNDAIKHLNGSEFPNWDFIVDYVRELPDWSQFCLFWEDSTKIYQLNDLKSLCKTYSGKTVKELESIYDGIDLWDP